MRSVNAQLKLRLKELLSDIDYPVYNNYVPASEAGIAYVLISDVVSTDTSTMHSSDTDTAVQIGIYTRGAIHNDDSLADEIGQDVYERIYPNPGFVITMPDGIQNYGISAPNDTAQVINLNSLIFINRIIIFNFNLKH